VITIILYIGNKKPASDPHKTFDWNRN